MFKSGNFSFLNGQFFSFVPKKIKNFFEVNFLTAFFRFRFQFVKDFFGDKFFTSLCLPSPKSDFIFLGEVGLNGWELLPCAKHVLSFPPFSNFVN